MKVNTKLLNDTRLAPFYACVLLYYILYRPFEDSAPFSIITAFFKCSPTWSLVYYVNTTRNGPGIPDDNYAQNIKVALLFSSLGDTLLSSHAELFVFGLLAYSVANAFYLVAMGPAPLLTRGRGLFFLGGLGCFLFVQEGVDSNLTKSLVLMYVVQIFSVGWRANSRFEFYQTDASLFGSIGTLCLLFSDFIIAVNKWRFGIPACEFLIVTSYYAGQLGIAISCTPPKTMKKQVQ